MTNERLAWVVAILAYVPFPVLYWAFRRRLASRRDEYSRLLGYRAPSQSAFGKFSFRAMPGRESEPEAESSPIRAKFDAAYSGQNPRVEFARHYSLDSYLTPLLLLALTVPLTTLSIFATAKLGDPLGLTTVVSAISRVSLIAAGASLVWAYQELVDRFQSGLLTSDAMNNMWLRPLVAALVAPALADAASESLQYLVAITIGLFPAETLKRWLLSKTAGIRPKVEEDPPSLQFLQGMTEDIQATLREERIERIQHLAYRNPYQILLRCNLEWSTIIDFVDQALLVQYVGAKIESLRMIGIRGAIDMAAVYDRVVSSPEDMKEADPVLRRIGEILGENEQIARNIGYTLWTDPVVQFLWEQWFASSPDGDTSKVDKLLPETGVV